ncbi:EAL domain-containing protein [Photobacterium sp. SDRW27]|uniref:EAL domain-containing protein n=1 Tax=Photobacterium obscurum TaxID=2829490 RepID=UPI0022443246|nr:EAL domain-containing protein [Photobacterium obscurum]MCW8329325.1 EAL domain-containing protein [Photobacterium obscurum]
MLFGNRFSETATKFGKCFTYTRPQFLSLAFVLGLALLLSSTSGFFSKLQLSYVISSDSRELLNTYSMKINDFPEVLSELSKNFQFDCGLLDQHQLQHIAYNDYVIRRITLTTSNGEQCTSFTGADVEARLAPLIDKLSPNVSLWVASESRNEQNLLVAEWKDQRGSLLLHLEPLISESIRNKYCNDCVLSSISSINNPTVSFWRGDASLFSSAPLFSSELGGGLRVNTFVKKELLARYQDNLWLPLFLLGGALGIICIYLQHTIMQRKLSLHSLVEQGIAKEEFVPYYQPIVDVSSNSLYGCEMLARWKRPGQEVISPMEFIPYVEKSGQILPITDQLIKKAILEISKLNWQATKQVISINVVPDQLESLDVMEKSLSLLQYSEIKPDQIAFEVTERKQFTDLTMASDVIEQLRIRGINVKLDDAGTGYGGFSYIQQLNIRSLKIDKMFVENIGTSDIKLSLLDSIIAFGKEAGMEMIAEGVETEEQSQYLAEQGVYLQQGYFFGRPMIFRDFAYFCKSMASHNHEEKKIEYAA